MSAPFAPASAIDARASRACKAFKVPGLALAVCDARDTLYARGFGLRDLARRKPMTPDTLCMLASVSKSFTVSAMHAAADAGHFDWDRPVREWLPEFQLADVRATEELTPRDLVCHRSGLPRHDHVWLGSRLTRGEIVARLRHLPPFAPLRARYWYQNLMYMTAGHLLERVTGRSWEDNLRATLFAPLGLKRAGFSLPGVRHDADHALGYELVRGKPVVAKLTEPAAMGPTGGVIASVNALARFLSMHLAGGVWRGKRVLSEAAVQAMQTPHTPMREAIEWPELGETQYGMGWFITRYRGHRFVHHGGNLPGFSTFAALLPDAKIGVALAVNAGVSPLRAPLTYSIFDLLLDLSPIDWIERYQDYVKKAAAAANGAGAGSRAPAKGTASTRPLSAYVGHYRHPGYGDVQIAARGRRLTLTFNGETAPLQNINGDAFRVPANRLLHLERLRVVFDSDFDGTIAGLRATFEPMTKAIAFERIVPPRFAQAAHLRRFVGTYQIGPTQARVEWLRGAALRLTLQGDQRFALVPSAELEFRAAHSDSVSLRFTRDARGRIDHLHLTDASGESVGVRVKSGASS
jgi:CubicO group peptidase (beta-lactamase class C family)